MLFALYFFSSFSSVAGNVFHGCSCPWSSWESDQLLKSGKPRSSLCQGANDSLCDDDGTDRFVAHIFQENRLIMIHGSGWILFRESWVSLEQPVEKLLANMPFARGSSSPRVNYAHDPWVPWQILWSIITTVQLARFLDVCWWCCEWSCQVKQFRWDCHSLFYDWLLCMAIFRVVALTGQLLAIWFLETHHVTLPMDPY